MHRTGALIMLRKGKSAWRKKDEGADLRVCLNMLGVKMYLVNIYFSVCGSGIKRMFVYMSLCLSFDVCVFVYLAPNEFLTNSG